jgi:beta-galactosidase
MYRRPLKEKTVLHSASAGKRRLTPWISAWICTLFCSLPAKAQEVPEQDDPSAQTVPALPEPETEEQTTEPAVPTPAETKENKQARTAEVVQDEHGFQLLFNGVPYFIEGMNWGYMPVGENYSYDFWGKTDAFIERVLHRDMGLLKRMNVNSIRQYAVIPPRWVTWIYENYGISTMINPLFGRYGINIEGNWIPQVDYADPTIRKAIREDTLRAVETYKDVPGVLLWLLGNENNYGIHWTSFEIEALPDKAAKDNARAASLYSLVGEVTDAIHATDPNHPVALCNGDLQYLNVIAEHASQIDILASNVYRGRSARDLFERVQKELNKPVLLSEFGSDAYDAARGRENAVVQASYLQAQWQELYEQSHGKGRAGNAIGGYTFQWADGWWKYLQEENLDVHDNNASWPNGGYSEDFVEGQNNMNEEWFGICAKTPSDSTGFYELQPRPAYYVLQAAHSLDAYAPELNVEAIQNHFSTFAPEDFRKNYAADRSRADLEVLQKAILAGGWFDMSTYTTTHANAEGDGKEALQLDHLESFYLQFALAPDSNLSAEMELNVLGNVPTNRIDSLSYETRGAKRFAQTPDGTTQSLSALERVRVYGSSAEWNSDFATIKGYYRRGHYHWGDEGDFFGLYKEAFYGASPDTYNADVPIGVEVEGKGSLKGMKMAFGPQVYWGANPTLFLKGQRSIGSWGLAAVHQEDLASPSLGVSSSDGGAIAASTGSSVPEQMTRKTTLHGRWGRGGLAINLGGIFAGSNKIGQGYRGMRSAQGEASYAGSGMDVFESKIGWKDTLGAKGRLSLQRGPWGILAEGAYQGLVADGGEDNQLFHTGWSLAGSARGNHYHGRLGMAFNAGIVQFAPNVLFQRPLEDSLSRIDSALNASSGKFFPEVSARNVITDPFAVLDNRETWGAELLIAIDPTPGTWMWQWDNPYKEDAPYSFFLDLVYRHQPTQRDSMIAMLENGSLFSFGEAPEAADHWDARARLIRVWGAETRGMLYATIGQTQAHLPDARLLLRSSIEATAQRKLWVASAAVHLSDFGPYDYHRDFDLTYPLQVKGSLYRMIKKPKPNERASRWGFSASFRTMDENSDFYDDFSGKNDPYQLEIGTHLQVGL